MDRRVIIQVIAAAAVLAAAATAAAVDRDTVVATAQSYASHVWTSTQQNVTASCSSSYRSDYSPGTHVGVCYDWGAYKTLDQFDADIAAGQGAGSHSKNGVLDCTTGVDCSGFVSECWQEQHYTTSTISQISTQIASKDVKKGDIFNKAGSHVVLFSNFAANGAPVFYEASGSASKVRLNTSGGWTFLNGYTPRRYDKIQESAAPSCPAPKEIAAFPFTDTDDTSASACDSFSAYSCAPKTKESGPEVRYKVTVPKRGTLTAAVTCGTGVDIDIHLLGALDPNACLARGDKKIAVKVDPGVYYLSADTYTGASGNEYDGPYRLDVDFTPEGTAADAGVADGGVHDAGIDSGIHDAGSDAGRDVGIDGGHDAGADGGTPAGYIEIPSFPYTDTRDTRNSTHDLWDSYSCAPSTGEKGPEYVYHFAVTQNGKVTATVTDGTGVDIDIHLLSAPDPGACIARNDTSVSADITAGSYYLSADTYSNSSGTEFPGQYTLDVTFSPAGTGKGTLIGSMWNTYYYLSSESDYTGAKDTALYDMQCQAISTVPAKYSDAVCIEGSGKLDDGRVINYAGTCSCGRACPTGGTVCYSVLDPAAYPWGMGAQSRPLTPLASWAVDKSLIPIGTPLYAEEWDGVAIPAVDGIGGFTHNGCFVADDVGGAITGTHYDFFAGTKSMWQTLEGIKPTNSTFTVYKNPPRCP